MRWEKKEERQNDQEKERGVREVQGRVDSDRRRLITAMKKGDTKSRITTGKKATLETKKEMEERAKKAGKMGAYVFYREKERKREEGGGGFRVIVPRSLKKTISSVCLRFLPIPITITAGCSQV